MSREINSLLQRIKDDPYKVLGISQGASLSEIKKAYFKLIQQHSPEKDPEGFKCIRAAYEQIRSEGRKKETDFLLFEDTYVSQDFEEKQTSLTNVYEDIIDVEIWRLLETLNKKK